MKYLVLLLAIGCSGCAMLPKFASEDNTRKTIQEWRGQSVDHLIEVLGSPNKISHTPNGLEVYEYFISHGASARMPSGNNPWASNTVAVNENYCDVRLTISNGVVQSGRFNGNTCRVSYPNQYQP